MRRLIHPKPALLFVALAALVFAAPHPAHAVGFLDVFSSFSEVIGRIFILPLEILVLPFAGLILYLAGVVMDGAIQFSLHTAYIFSLSPAINLGWVIVRDLANIFFIFVLIYISLGTIVRGLGFGTKKLLKDVIIAALLINFSLFATKAIVDVSNLFGNWLYGGIQKTLVANSSDPNNPTSLSGLIASRLGVIGFWSAKDNANGTGGVSGIANLSDPSKGFASAWLRLIIVSIAIYIFMYCAVLFIARSVTILFLMVFSPIGFMGSVLPQISSYSKKWWHELSSAAMFPISFLLLLYISLQFINSLQDLSLAQLNDKTIPGLNISVSLIFQYFLIIFLLKATLKIAKENSGEIGDAFGSFASSLGKIAVNAVGTYATGGAMLALRAGGRGLGAAISAKEGESRWDAFKKTGKENLPPILTEGNKYIKMARDKEIGLTGALKQARKDTNEAVANKMKSGTWDIRNIGVGDNKVGNLVTGNIVGATGEKGIDFKAMQAKELKARTAEWNEEKKIEQANYAILTDLDKVARKQLELDRLTDAQKKAGDADYDKAANELAESKKTANATIIKHTQGLGNSQLGKLDKKILKNEEVVRTLSANQVEYLADKAEKDDDKAAIWKARLSDVNKNTEKAKPDPAGKTPEAYKDELKKWRGNVKKAAKTHADKELENLPVETLKNPDLVHPDAMDYDTFQSLIKSNKIPFGVRGEMLNNRYKDLDAAIDSNDGPRIGAELDKLDENEIAKLGWNKEGKDGTRLSNPEVIVRLSPKVLGKLFDSLDEKERTEIKNVFVSRGVNIQGAGTSDKVEKNKNAVQKWFKDNNIGKQF